MDQIITEILKAGFLGALLLLQGWYFVKKEEKLFASLDKKDESRRVENEKHAKDQAQMTEKMIDMVLEHATSISQINETVEHLSHIMTQFEGYAKEQRYLRLMLEKELGFRQPGRTEKFYTQEDRSG